MGGEGILETKGVPLYTASEKRGLGKGARISYTCRVRYTVYSIVYVQYVVRVLHVQIQQCRDIYRYSEKGI